MRISCHHWFDRRQCSGGNASNGEWLHRQMKLCSLVHWSLHAVSCTSPWYMGTPALWDSALPWSCYNKITALPWSCYNKMFIKWRINQYVYNSVFISSITFDFILINLWGKLKQKCVFQTDLYLNLTIDPSVSQQRCWLSKYTGHWLSNLRRLNVQFNSLSYTHTHTHTHTHRIFKIHWNNP